MSAGDGGDSIAARTSLALAAALAVVLVAVSGLGIAADTAFRRTYDTRRPLEQRLRDAWAAKSLAPWEGAYAVRETVVLTWLRGRQLLEAGDYSGSVNVLASASRLEPKDAELAALYKRAQKVEDVATTRKAHLQHGHEGPSSSLRPQDVER